jgi:hypothetical protein
MAIRLVVFEEPNESEYDAAWTEIKTHNWYTEAQIKKYDEGNYPFYIDSRNQLNIKLHEYAVSFWAARSSNSKSYKLTGEGGVWRIKRIERLIIDGKDTKVILADLTNDVNGLRFPVKEYKILQTCVRDYFRENKSKKIKSPILMHVQIGDLHRLSGDFR